jgi:hypothetical protein
MREQYRSESPVAATSRLSLDSGEDLSLEDAEVEQLPVRRIPFADFTLAVRCRCTTLGACIPAVCSF